MPDLILHHFDISPFAEKARMAMGLKGLNWSSVEIPIILPKPDLMPLTGGYRKTPVLQVGADIYCDTLRIARELEARHPEPSLFPDNSEGLALALSFWSDKAFFEPGAGLSMGENAEIPAPVLEDRVAFFNFMDFSRLAEELPHLHGQLRAHAAFVERQLGDGRAFLLGERPGWADIDAYFVLWMARANIPSATVRLAEFAALPPWEGRMRALGHGSRSALSAAAALDIARDATPARAAGVARDDPLGLEEGAPVTVAPDDYGKDPVAGRLVTLTCDEVAVQRCDERVGDVVVHFPRSGYRISAA